MYKYVNWQNVQVKWCIFPDRMQMSMLSLCDRYKYLLQQIQCIIANGSEFSW